MRQEDAHALLGLDVEGSPAVVVALAIGNAVLGMSLGLLVSAFAATEFAHPALRRRASHEPVGVEDMSERIARRELYR